MSKEYTRLDLGCGNKPTGNCNVDLYINDIGHQKGNIKKITGLIPKCNLIIWDLDKTPLPFEDNSYDEVYCRHTIEHINFPFALIKEMYRIARKQVIIICPHEFGERLTLRKNPFHKGYFKPKWFLDVGKILNISIIVENSKYVGFPHKYFSLFNFPFEITVTIFKEDGVIKIE